jgi:hypothetical protein
MFNTYASIMASQPTLFQSNTLATISAVAGPVGSGFQLYENVSNLSGGWTGSAQQAQGSQAASVLSKGQQVLSAITQTQQMINAGAQQLQNAKARLVALTKGATAEGFVVLPVGTAVLGPRQLARIAALHAHQHHALAVALRVHLLARAAAYNSQINLVVLQTNAADAQVALTLANSAVSILGSLTQKDSSNASVPEVSSTPLPTAAAPGALTPATPTATGTPALTGAGTALAGAGPLGAAGTTPLGLAGAGGAPLAGGSGLPGTAGLNPAALGGTAGLGGMAGAGRGALAGEMAGRGAAGAGPGMLYGGAGAAGGELHEEERDHEGSDWLAEDGDPWHTDEVAGDVGGVLS